MKHYQSFQSFTQSSNNKISIRILNYRMINKSIDVLISSLLVSMFLIACSGISTSATPKSTIIGTTFVPTKTHYIEAANPTYVAFYFGPEPINDDKFKILIEDVGGKCHDKETSIPIKFTLTNLQIRN